eukprot:2216323-Prymnesium_polylepis.1
MGCAAGAGAVNVQQHGGTDELRVGGGGRQLSNEDDLGLGEANGCMTADQLADDVGWSGGGGVRCGGGSRGHWW